MMGHTLHTHDTASIYDPMCGNVFVTLGDGAKGFNLVVIIELAAQVLAVLSEGGCRLWNVLQLGPVNGPFDFSFNMDELAPLSPETRAPRAHLA